MFGFRLMSSLKGLVFNSNFDCFLLRELNVLFQEKYFFGSKASELS